MMLGRGLLGNIVMIVFILFNVVMLGLMGLAYRLKNIPPKEIRAEMLLRATEWGRETRDDRQLDEQERAHIAWAVNKLMKVVVLAQEKEPAGILILWLIGVGALGVLLYYTRPQPI